MANFVSRAGEKLQYALNIFNISVKDLVAADFGSSTGGFVDCLLLNGIKKVYSIDTAYGELAWKLRHDPRVIVMERTNAMHVVLPPPSQVIERQGEKVDLVTIDVSWTKQKNILPGAFRILKPGGKIISLIKPHYEAGKGKLDEKELEPLMEKVKAEIAGVGGKIIKMIESPILGEKGKNREFLALLVLAE